MDGGSGYGRFREQSVEVAKLFLKLAELLVVNRRRTVFDGEWKLRFLLAEFAFDNLSCSGDGIALVVKKGLDVKGSLYIAAAIEALASAAFVGLELRELALPETEDVGGNVAEFGDFSDAEVELVRDVGPGCGVGSADWLMLRHAKVSGPPRGGVAYRFGLSSV